MRTLDRPELPEVPQFSRDMQAFLRTAAGSRLARRQRAGRRYLAVAVAAVAVIAAVVFGIVHTSGPGGAPHGRSTGPAGLARFSVTSAHGLVTLQLTPGRLRDPNALRRALAHAGVPALVTAGSVCYVPGPSNSLPQVLPARQHHAAGRMVWTINPAAIPAGDELSIGYYQVPGGFGIHISLVPEHGPLICRGTPPTPPRD